MGSGTLHKILDVYSASVRNSLQGFGYFTAQGTQAFDDLESVVDKLGEDCGMKEKKEQLKEGKIYLKSDYKAPLLSLLSLLLSLLLLLLLLPV